MPVHHNIDRFKLLEEIKRLEDANKKITFILPELIQHTPGGMYGVVDRYLIIFEDK